MRQTDVLLYALFAQSLRSYFCAKNLQSKPPLRTALRDGSQPLKIVFLPGMDGTGLLFKGLIQNIPKEIDREVVCLNEIEGESYHQQAEEVAEHIGSSSVVLVAESYSGRIAYELCNILGRRVSRVVFIASFISCPGRLGRLAALLPELFLKPNFFPDWLMKTLCFDGRGNRVLIEQVRQAITEVEPSVLKRRLLNIAELDRPKGHLSTEAVYIRPTNDRLVGYDAIKVLGNVYPKLSIESLEGGHFIAQTAPERCARVIVRAITT
ncbi:alpha/beta fold hydrolase [Microbulbifer agarilyticus]|uniref:alpha/beta fold hydrolase n=1 Tax=Microbulbifer agarilyticus TaxID=260552 RepID=UPI001CD322D4|nr:alpha/beta hydrolase [Microbulbifer agarilyticus]MCA0901113.1 alpha/beta hydrolase [Microbulbifer agarilyticus]